MGFHSTLHGSSHTFSVSFLQDSDHMSGYPRITVKSLIPRILQKLAPSGSIGFSADPDNNKLRTGITPPFTQFDLQNLTLGLADCASHPKLS